MNPIGTIRKLSTEHCWFPFGFPIAVFLVIGSMEPKPNSTSWLPIPYDAYPWIYAGKLLATVASLVLVWPELKPFLQGIGWKGITVGFVGGVLWIAICNLGWEQSTLRPWLNDWGLGGLIGAGDRSAFNPFQELRGNSIAVFTYLLVRGIGLILIVPIIEEHFLRGLVMRYFATEEWTQYPIGRVTLSSALIGTLLPMLMHPGELLAAAVWFSMISVLAWHSKNLWECIAAHGVTNLVIGVYVIAYGAWWLV
jgi:uncharacterized protein